MYHLSNIQFPGVSGPVQFHGADRVGIINIQQYIGNTSVLIGQYLPDKNESERTTLNEAKIVWMMGKKPEDGRQGKNVYIYIWSHMFLHACLNALYQVYSSVKLSPFVPRYKLVHVRT